MKKLTALLTLILVFVLLLSACGSKDKSSGSSDKKTGGDKPSEASSGVALPSAASSRDIEGLWKDETKDTYMEFADGKVFIRFGSASAAILSEGEYKLSGGKMTITMNGKESSCSVGATKDKLTITENGRTTTYVRLDKTAADAGKTAAAGKLDGVWKEDSYSYNDLPTWYVRNDKFSVVYPDGREETGTFELDGDTITATFGEETYSGYYELNDDWIYLYINGRSMYFDRCEEPSSMRRGLNIPNPFAGFARSSNIALSSGSSGLEGKWLEATYDEYWVFYKDGRFEATNSNGYTLSGTYQTDGDEISISLYGQTSYGTYSVSGNILTLTIEGETVKFTRQ